MPPKSGNNRKNAAQRVNTKRSISPTTRAAKKLEKQMKRQEKEGEEQLEKYLKDRPL
jgi:hypothetical protein